MNNFDFYYQYYVSYCKGARFTILQNLTRVKLTNDAEKPHSNVNVLNYIATFRRTGYHFIKDNYRLII